MRISQSFFKTERATPSDVWTESYKFLFRGGFVRPMTGGRYTLLPLGMKVEAKIVKIIEEELNASGGQRIRLPMMEFAQESRFAEDNLAPRAAIAEDRDALAADLFLSIRPSYKDLPLVFYHFINLSRDRMNAREGLIQAGEFPAMKCYGLDGDERLLLNLLGSWNQSFRRIFARIGLEPIPLALRGGPKEGGAGRRFVLVSPPIPENLDLFWEEGEDIQPIEDIDVSRDYKLHKKILRSYSQHPEKTLKSMLLRSDQTVVCITIRGDYRIDLDKVKKKMNTAMISPLTEKEIQALGSFPGFVSAIGLDKTVRILIDDTVRYNKNYWDGGNKEGVFRKNVNFDRDFETRDTVDIREDKVYAAGGDKIITCDLCDYGADLDDAEFVREAVNLEEEMKEFGMIDQPEWVCSMDDMVQHYNVPQTHFLKNVVYKDSSGRVIIAVLRGDLEASPVKIENILGCGALQLAEADDFDRLKIQAGSVHSWGHDQSRLDVTYISDESLRVSRNLIGGFKEETHDAFNVNYGRDFSSPLEADIAKAYEGAKCPRCPEGHLRENKGMELGRISEHPRDPAAASKVFFIGRDGKAAKTSFGMALLDIGRLMAGVVEIHRDEKGIIWPKNIAPYFVTLVTIGRSPNTMEQSEKVYKLLKARGYEVLWDDRIDVSAGGKLMDTDLIGNPVRLVISDRTLKADRLEMKLRSKEGPEYWEFDERGLIVALENLERSLTEKEGP